MASTYAIVQDMADLFGSDELTQLVPKTVDGVLTYDSDLVQKAIDNATAEIDAYLSSRYRLPLSSVPAILKRLTCDVARYQLFGASLTEEVEKRYKNAVSFLKSVSSGTASLGISSDGSEIKPSGSVLGFGSRRVFSAESLREYSDQ